MARKNLINQKGQTAVEYIFLLAVIVSVITSIFSVIKSKYLGDATKCQSTANQKLMMCKINGFISPNGDDTVKKFQYYPFKK